MRGLGADPRRQLLLRIAIAPAQEVDDVERLDLAEQLCAGIGLGALQRLLEQSERLEPGGDVLWAVDDLADADDDGNAVFRDVAIVLVSSCMFRPSLRGASAKQSSFREASWIASLLA